MYVFELGALGRSFATRGRGAELRERLLADATSSHVEVDFTGVTHVSSSFADEFLGRLITDDQAVDLTVFGLTSDVERVVQQVLARRRDRALAST